MGRNAKLRASRHTGSDRLVRRQQHQQEVLRHGVSIGARLDPQRLFDTVGGIEALPSKKESDAFISKLSPSQFTKYAGRIYTQLITANIDGLDAESLSLFVDLKIISPQFFEAFSEYQAFCMFRQPGRHDLALLRRHIVSLAQIPEFAVGLKAFGLGPDARGRGRTLYRLMNGSMLGAGQHLKCSVLEDKLSKEAFVSIVQFWLLAGDHVESAGDIAAGRVLCDAGELVLHYRRAERLHDAELCLSHRAADGLLHFNPDPEAPSISASAIRKLRAFVRQYKGPKMAGKISDHPGAPRLCRAIGLQTKQGYGFLQEQGNQDCSLQEIAV
jgi:hypothetical protein